MSNIFTAIIQTLNTIPVSGDENHRKMIVVIDTLRRMEKTAEEKEDGDG